MWTIQKHNARKIKLSLPNRPDVVENETHIHVKIDD